MLCSLYIKNFALIDDISVEFAQGLNVLTGETGAGKSILLDALLVALGGRASAEFIRAGEDKAVIQAAFEAENAGIEQRLNKLGIIPSEDGVMVLSREISSSGRNLCRVNGQVVTLAMYRQAAAGLVDMHGQHQQQLLLDSEHHLKLLDYYGGEELIKCRNKTAENYKQWKQLQTKLQQMQDDSREAARQIDMLQFQVQEIEKANLTVDEDNQLEQERNILANAEKIATLTNSVKQCLYTGGGKHLTSAVELIGEAVHALRQLTEYDKTLEPQLQALESAFYAVEDTAQEISRYNDKIEFDPSRLDYIEKRLSEINSLKRKYGSTVADILDYCEKTIDRLNELTYNEENIDNVKTQVQQALNIWKQQAELLSELRKKTAKRLEKAVAAELADLEMDKVIFKVGFEQAAQPSAKGIDDICFLIAPNPGEPLKPLHKIASGGELSRIMLAVKSLLAGVDQVPTLIFDEVDTGVGGLALNAVGKKMAQIGRQRQVITVTHAPQVACFANNHFFIKKEVVKNRTFTRITKLDYQGRVNELARMLGAQQIDGIEREHAETLLKAARAV